MSKIKTNTKEHQADLRRSEFRSIVSSLSEEDAKELLDTLHETLPYIDQLKVFKAKFQARMDAYKSCRATPAVTMASGGKQNG